jgi:hypothetical protein
LGRRPWRIAPAGALRYGQTVAELEWAMDAGVSVPATLTFVQADTVFRPLAQIAEHIDDYITYLTDHGFEAFRPGMAFVESFCNSREQLDVHQRCIVETAKIVLAIPRPMAATREEKSKFFRSEYLNALAQERDRANGVPLSELASTFPADAWRTEVDPCRANQVYQSIKQQQAFEVKEREARRQSFQLLALEATRHSTSIDSTAIFDADTRFSVYGSVMSSAGKAVGFAHDQGKSYDEYPIFSKPLTPNWDLCWTIEDVAAFTFARDQAVMRLNVELRARKLKGPIRRAKNGEAFGIQLARIVPSFGWAYNFCRNLQELETAIKAHWCLYEAISERLESTLRAGLISLGEQAKPVTAG